MEERFQTPHYNYLHHNLCLVSLESGSTPAAQLDTVALLLFVYSFIVIMGETLARKVANREKVRDIGKGEEYSEQVQWVTGHRGKMRYLFLLRQEWIQVSLYHLKFFHG